MADFILYNYYRSSTSYRIRIALNHKNIPYEYQAVHLLNDGGEHKKPQYLNINPMGGVPTLVHKGKAISQSMAILEYIEEIAPSPALLPTSSYDKAKVRQICENINCELHPLANLRVMQYLEKKHSYNLEQKEEWIQHWNHIGLSAIEKILEKTSSEFAYGNTVTAADVFIVPHLYSSRRFKTDLSAYPNILKIEKNCLQLEAFKKAHPDLQIDSQ